MSGKPTVATVPPSFTVRLAAIGSGANRPTAFNKARSFAESTFTDLATEQNNRKFHYQHSYHNYENELWYHRVG
jgi:hypothetical protein